MASDTSNICVWKWDATMGQWILSYEINPEIVPAHGDTAQQIAWEVEESSDGTTLTITPRRNALQIAQ